MAVPHQHHCLGQFRPTGQLVKQLAHSDVQLGDRFAAPPGDLGDVEAGRHRLGRQLGHRAALKVAHRGYVLDSGKVTLEGSAAELRQDPQVVAAYLGA